MASVMTEDNSTTIEEMGPENTNSNEIDIEPDSKNAQKNELEVMNSDKNNGMTTVNGGAVIKMNPSAHSLLTVPNKHMDRGRECAMALIKPTSYERIIELQKDPTPPALMNSMNAKSPEVQLEGLKLLVEKYPKELLVCICCMGVILGIVCNSYNALLIVSVIGIFYLASSYMDKWCTIQNMSGRDQIKNHQLKTFEHLSDLNAATVKVLGEQSLAVEKVRKRAAIGITKIEGEVQTEKFRSINENHRIDSEGRTGLKLLEELGETKRVEIARQEKENLAQLEAETSKHLAGVQKSTRIGLKKMELEHMKASVEKPQVEVINETNETPAPGQGNPPPPKKGGPCVIA